MELIDDYSTPWVYEAAITDPTGLRVHVTTTVPAGNAWEMAKECGDFAQMAAELAMQGARKSRKTEQERCPF